MSKATRSTVTRRGLAALAGVPLLAQQPVAEDDLEIQRQNLRRNREQLGKVALPITTEPAFTFKA